MTKKEALDVLLQYIDMNGFPINDEIVICQWTEKEPNILLQWTYIGLRNFILS